MAKKAVTKLLDAPVQVSFSLSDVLVEDYVRSAVERQVQSQVEATVETAVAAAVQDAVNTLGLERIGKAVDRVLAEGWDTTNEYGEVRGTKLTLKDRIGKLLNMQESYGSSRSWLNGLVKDHVTKTLHTDLKADIEAAKAKFKAEVDAVLTATIRESLAKSLGLKT